MAPPLSRRAHQALVWPFAELRRRSLGGQVVKGHHNSNHIVSLGQPLAFLLGVESGQVQAKFRTPYETVEVVPRIWPRESEVLRAVKDRLGEVPRCLVDFGTWSVHAYLSGRALSEAAPKGRIGSERLAALAGFFASLPDVPVTDLPELPADWPQDGDSRGFLRWLARFTEERVHQVNRPRFGTLFDAIGVPRDAIERFMSSVPGLSRRPFTLLHTDVHRANVVVEPEPDGERLSVIDWELAMFGDPLHDLATHLVRMDYNKAEHGLMIRMWADAMRHAGHPAMTLDMDRDLRCYVDFEYVQSIFPDVMRAALALPDDPGEKDLSRAAERVCRAMRRAREPLGLMDASVDELVAGEALRQWHKEDRALMVDRAGGAEGAGLPGSAERVGSLERHGC